MRWLIAAACVLAVGCGSSSPSAPTPTPITPALPFSGRVVLSGQSNAVNVAPALSAYGTVAVAAQKSLSIDYWSATNPDVTMWRDLKPLLHEPLRAFVWWQGESDAANAHYQADLIELMQRVRAEANQPALPLILVRVLNRPKYAGIRAIQANAVTMLGAALVSIDVCEVDGDSDHLTAAGYECAAAQIARAIH